MNGLSNNPEACMRKVRYGHQKTAMNAAEAMKRKGAVLEVYPCACCGGWHIGHKPRWFRVRIERVYRP